MNKDRIRAHFRYSWWVYLVIAAAATALWCSVFAKLADPKADEMLNITFVGETEPADFSDDLRKALEGKTSKPLKEINLEVVSSTNGMIGDIIAMRCLGGTDLIIFEEDALLEPMSSNFGGLDREQMRERFGDAVFYEEDGDLMGLLLYDGEAGCRFLRYYSGNQKCWVFIPPKAENTARLNGEGDAEDDAALQAIQYLMEKD